jgi:hypothetical protein
MNLSINLSLSSGRSSGETAIPLGITAIDTASGNSVMLDVWNSKPGRSNAAVTGNNASLTSTTSVTGTPSGWSTDPSLRYSPTTAGWSLSNWFFDNAQALIRSGGTMTNCKFNVPGSGAANTKLIDVGYTGSAGNLVLARCDFSGVGMVCYYAPGSPGLTGSAALLSTTTNYTSISITNARFDHAPLVMMKLLATTITLTDSFMGTFGFDPKDDSLPDATANSHMEQMFVGNGANTFTRVLFDTSDANTDPTNTLTTGIHYIEGDLSGNITVAYVNCIIKGGQTQGISGGAKVQTAVALAAKNATTVNVTFTNCAIEHGQGYYIQTQAETGGGVVTVTDGGGNRDLNTGTLLTVTKNTLAP